MRHVDDIKPGQDSLITAFHHLHKTESDVFVKTLSVLWAEEQRDGDGCQTLERKTTTQMDHAATVLLDYAARPFH